MSKTITKEWLREKGACTDGYNWFLHQRSRDELKVLEKLIQEEHFEWANWLIVRRMERKQYIQYAIFAAEQVIDIYEKQIPDDKRPRLAIEAARRCLIDDSDAAWAAGDAARAAGDAARAAGDAAWAAGDAAWAAGAAAWDAVWDAAWAAAWDAARAAAWDAARAATRAEMQKIILDYGISLLETSNE